MQWSIIAESLRRSHHAKGAHGYGSLIRGGRGARISFHHNLWAHHVARMPRPGNYAGPEADPEGPLMEFRSNVFYNWGRGFAGYNEDEATLIRYNFIDNAYVAGPDSEGAIAFRERNRLARAWFAGNSMNGAVPADPWSLVGGHDPRGYRLAGPVEVAPVAADPAPLALRACSPAPAPGRATPPTRGSSQSVREPRRPPYRQPGGGRRLAGARAGAAEPDRDGDGMPDAWERAHGFDPARADGNGDRDGDGMTNLEDWLAARARRCRDEDRPARPAARLARGGPRGAGRRRAAAGAVAARARRLDRPLAGRRAGPARRRRRPRRCASAAPIPPITTARSSTCAARAWPCSGPPGPMARRC